MCGVLVLASRFTSTTLKITHLPSGETTGSPTRLSFIMSSKVKGCLAWAKAAEAKMMRASAARKKRRMRTPRKAICRGVACYVFAGGVGAAGKALQATSPRQTEKCSRICARRAEGEDALGQPEGR